MIKRAAIASFAFFSFVNSSPASAETDYVRVFAGEWVTYSREYSGVDPCTLTLERIENQGAFFVSSENCGGDMRNVSGWKIKNGQMVLVDHAGRDFAALGGNQNRLSGATAAGSIPFVLERKELAVRTWDARKSIDCSFLGYSQDCAEPSQFTPPLKSYLGSSQVQVLVDLNTRAEPRPDANVVSVAEENACIEVVSCTLASDGYWCRGAATSGHGWFRKQAIRQKKWPIVTFTNGCPAAESE